MVFCVDCVYSISTIGNLHENGVVLGFPALKSWVNVFLRSGTAVPRRPLLSLLI